MQIFKPVSDYGDNIFCGIEPDDQWKENVNMARDEI